MVSGVKRSEEKRVFSCNIPRFKVRRFISASFHYLSESLFGFKLDPDTRKPLVIRGYERPPSSLDYFKET
jgi:hypothetical protein